MALVLVLSASTGCYEQGGYDVDDYWRELANAHCTDMTDCCTRAEYNDWWTTSDGDRYDCIAAHDAPSYAQTIRDDIRSGKITFVEQEARSCVIALETMACADFQPGIRYRETYCTPPLHGHLPTGAGPCTIDEECESRHCGPTQVCVPGIPAGGYCANARTSCDAPLRCQDDGYCGLGAPGTGASCTSDSQCEGDWCKDIGLFTPGTCTQACQGGA